MLRTALIALGIAAGTIALNCAGLYIPGWKGWALIALATAVNLCWLRFGK